ncbi:MAG: hypothetical protein IKF58_12070, partial [Bacillus sp. (in: Bacteria)]|nr:hypothetical protein [Bacillus sp. (in: firmicutes)]
NNDAYSCDCPYHWFHIWLPPFVIESLLSYGQGQANMTASFIHWTSLLLICLYSSSFDLLFVFMNKI